jgi:hypothetical protein
VSEYRTIIAYEGRKTEDGRIFDLGALYWTKLPLPVLRFEPEGVFRNTAGQIIGLHVVLNGDENEVWATLDTPVSEDYVLSLDGDDAVGDYSEADKEWRFSKMRIAAGTLIPREMWAWK